MIDKNNDPRKGMKVPEGFFDAFEDDLMARINTPAKVIPFWTKYKMNAIAAVFILAITAIFILKINQEPAEFQFAEFTMEKNWDYLLENPDELSIDELSEFEGAEQAINELELELYSAIASEEWLDDIDLDMFENLEK